MRAQYLDRSGPMRVDHSGARYSFPHGQCRSVGVGGYLLGGGVNWLGTYNKVRCQVNSQNIVKNILLVRVWGGAHPLHECCPR